MPNFKPERYHTLTPFFQINEAADFIDFAQRAFGARELERMQMPDGRITHAEYQIGDSVVMLAQGDTMPIALYAYLEDVDATYERALQAGAVTSQAPVDMFWGDRQAAVKDRWGNMWFIATHREDVSIDEVRRRMEKVRATA
jgi:PhnB protein